MKRQLKSIAMELWGFPIDHIPFFVSMDGADHTTKSTNSPVHVDLG